MEMQMRVELVTPEAAAQYLRQNTDNYRRISKQKVNLYAEEMKAGKWQLNGEGIVFGADGKLKNGQHRLAAIVLAGKPVKMTIISGVADEVTIYDAGSNRSTVQIARASGCGDMTQLEAAVGTAVVGRFDKVSKGKVVEWLAKHKDELNRAYRICGSGGKGISSRMSVLLAGYMMIRLEMIKSYELETFCKVLNTGNTVGADGYEPSPALVARRMYDERYKGMGGAAKTLRDLTEVMIMAMIDFQAGKRRQLNYRIGEPMKCMELMDRIRKADGLA